MKRLVAAWVAFGFSVVAGAAPQDGAREEEELLVPRYTITPTRSTPALDGDWSGPAWGAVPVLAVSHFYETPESGHRPKTEVKAVYDEKGIYIHFRVEDRYVRSIETEYHGKVWEDACVEFFVQPLPDRGYFNFEINCGGTMLLSYKEHPDWKGTPLREAGAVPWALAREVKIFHTMPEKVEPERAEAVTWQVEYFVPFSLFEAYLGPLGPVAGKEWRANFYKCAENNSHPHWASWSPIRGELNFHQPQYFAPIIFGE